MMGISTAGLQPFVVYFAVGAALTVVFAALYIRLTAHDEIALIRQGNVAAALAFGGNLAGFSIPLDKAISQASSVADCMLWAFVALVVQLAVYGLVRLLVPGLSAKIEANNLAVATFLALTAVVGGMLNAASMTLYPGG
jgi:putative membrane protein